MITDFSNREKECFTFLKLIPKEKQYVIIGGYAVTSFGFSRFSVDLDITIPESELPFFKKALSDNDFVFTKGKDDLLYSGKFERYEKGLVSIDLLINGVSSRQTGYLYPFQYLFKNSQIRETSGWDPLNKVKARIAKKEMLIALKIHSMRMTDKRDVIMLCYEIPNIRIIINHLKNSPKEKIIEHVNELLVNLNEKNLIDSIKGVYSIDDKIYKKTIENCQKTMNEIKERI
ncbi:MAG: hypothetical protein IMY73_01850 [Bacteroidetes bacterium]|nr:hypothetical protein [Bacteroidota bacterium]